MCVTVFLHSYNGKNIGRVRGKIRVISISIISVAFGTAQLTFSGGANNWLEVGNEQKLYEASEREKIKEIRKAIDNIGKLKLLTELIR